jgi:hypothetical protein
LAAPPSAGRPLARRLEAVVAEVAAVVVVVVVLAHPRRRLRPRRAHVLL